jgi:uncharacterized protein (TIGR00299 family) protein
MSILYIDCGMGAAGDMLTAALVELTDDPAKTVEELNSLNIPNTRFVREDSVKCGITGTHMRVIVDGQEEDEHMHGHHHEHHHDHDHEHHHHDEDHDHHHDHDHEEGHHHSHSSMHGIEHIVNDHINVSGKVKKDILDVYQLIAAAESKVHNTDIENIHFHEVGTMDAAADVAAVCYLIDKLGVREIYASPVHVGKGTVRCAHGILPVPAPATAEILKDIPIYSREEINGELCTPTGAALLKRFVKQFRPMPVMKTSKIGYGMGTKDFPIANCVRAILGEDDAIARGVVRELDFNVDDMTGEEIGFLNDVLLKNGAFEVFVTPVYMKKSRPGNLVTVLCSEENEEKIVELIFRHSTTIGIRETIKDRFILNRKIENVDTEFGTIRRKRSSGYGVDRSKFEYDDLAKAAEEKGLSIKEIIERIRDHE